MSSNIRIIRICQQCGNEFEARKTTSKTCSDACAKKAYKGKVEVSNQQTLQIKIKPIEDIKAQKFLTVDEPAKLIRISRRSPVGAQNNTLSIMNDLIRITNA